jgi:hypothetical protein
LLGEKGWIEKFKRTQGNLVIEELLLQIMATGEEPNQEKIVGGLGIIMLKILQSEREREREKEKGRARPKTNNAEKESMLNLSKISSKIMESLLRFKPQ